MNRLPPLLLDTTMFWSPMGGGVRRYLTAKSRWLQDGGVWRHVIAAPGVQAGQGVDVGGLPLPGSGGYRLPLRRRAAAQLMRDLGPVLIEAADPYRLAWSALDAAQALSIPSVAFCHSNLPALASHWAGRSGWVSSGARRAGEVYLRRIYMEFDLVLAPCQALVEMLCGLGLTRVRYQPLGVDVSIFRPRPADPDLRARLGLPSDARLLMYAGRFAPEKNLNLLVDVVDRLGPPYALLAVGAGPTPPRPHARVRLLPFEGDTEALATLIASADIFVHAGDQETFGLAVLEAMACGKAVIVRGEGGLAELVQDGAGYAVDGDAPERWAEAVAAVIADGPDHWYGPALQRARKFRWERVLPRLLRHYEMLTHENVALRSGVGSPGFAGTEGSC